MTSIFRTPQTIVIPKGSIALGEAKAVGDQSDERVAVTFHRIITPGRFGYGIPLDRGEPGLSQAGEAGLHDKVNRHYTSIFGASLALGAIGGLAQIGNGGGAYADPFDFVPQRCFSVDGSIVESSSGPFSAASSNASDS